MIGTRPLTPNSAGITGPMNINSVIAHLVELTPGQRKQFAQMHMDDTMLLSTVKYVDDQIGKQAAAKAAQMVGAAPPPVNQQVVAQMASQPPVPQAAPQPQAGPQGQPQGQPMPEESGIGQLPAPNMQGIARGAAGGIVAFADTGLVQDRQPGESFAAYRQRVLEGGKLPSKIAPVDNAPFPYTVNMGPFTESRDELIRQANAELERRRAANQMPTKSPYVTDTADLSQTPPAVAKPPAKPAAPAAPAVPVDRKETKTDKATADVTPKEKKGIDQLRVAPAPAVQPTIQASSAPAASGLDYNAAFSSALKAEGNPRDNLPPEINEIADLTKAQGEKEAAAAEKRGVGLKALVDARNERLAGREERVTQEENMNPFMSLLTAGLKTMQSKGKGLAGIAEGSEAGVAQYMAEAKYTTAQRQKLEDARDALEDLKFNQENMTEKERLAAQNTITQGAITAKKATVEHIAHKEDINLKTAGHKFDAMVQRDIETQREGHQMQLAGQNQQFQLALNASDNAQRLAIAQMQERAAAARASQLPGEVRAVQLLGGGDYEKGLRKMAEIQSDKTGQVYAKLYVEHVDNARKNNVDPLSPIDFAKQVRGVMAAMAPQGASVVTTKAPVTTGVLQRP